MSETEEDRRPEGSGPGPAAAPWRLTRRALLGRGAVVGGAALVAAAGGAGMVLDACSSSPSSRGGTSTVLPPSRSSVGVDRGRPRRGGTLRMATFSEVDGFDPTSSQWDTTGYLYGEAVFDPLAAFAPDGTVRPYLARSIDPSPDYATWTITLRPGVVFHDGTPLDAAALHLNLTKQVASPLTGQALSNIADVSVSGPLSVTVSMHTPWVPFPYYLADQPGYVAAPSMLADPNGALHPVGTGPFVFEKWERNVGFSARANPHYWRSGLPYLDAIDFRPFDNPASMSASMLSGALDAATSVDQSTILYFAGNRGYLVVDNAQSSTVQPDQNCIILNTAKAPVDDIRVRRALAHALNKQQIVDVAFAGLGAVSDGPFVKGSPWYAPTGYPSYDLSKAKALAREYAAQKGKIHIDLGVPSGNSGYTQVAELVQSMWQKVGITSTITQAEYTAYVADAAFGKFTVDGWQQFGCDDPDENYVWWSTETVHPDGQISLNVARNSDARIQRALVTGRTNPDPHARAAAYQEVGRYLAEDLPYLWINRSVSAVIATPKVRNFNATTFPDGSPGQGVSGGTFRFSTTWLA